MTTRAFRNAIEIRVRDNGVGIPAEHRDKLFQPFFTTKPTGEGTGLGRAPRGKRTVNSVNSPGALSTEMVPPCCWVTMS